MAAPTLLDYAESNWADISATVDTTDDLDWASAADVIVVLGATEDNGITMATPTGTGITLSALAGLPTNTASSCKGYGWSGAAAGNGNSVLTSTNGASGARGIAAWAYSGSDGLGTPVVTVSTALTHNITVLADSSVVMVLADWNATADVTVTTVPAGGTIREATQATGGTTATFLVIEWANQAAGTRAYGVSAWTGTGTITKVSVEVKGTAAGPQTISPSGIASAEAFGTATLTPGAVTVSPGGIVSAEAFGTPTLTASILVSPGGIASAEAFGTPTLTPGSVTVSPGGIASAEAFGTPTVTPGVVVVTSPGIVSGEAFGTPTLSAGAVIVGPTGIASAEALGTPTLTPGTVTVGATGIPSAEAFGTPTIVGAGTVSPTGIPSGEAFGTPTVTTGGVTVTPPGIPSGEAFGTPTLTTSITVGPAGIAGGEAFGTPTLTAGAPTVEPVGIDSAEAFGVATLSGGDVVEVVISPVGIGSGETFGTPVLTVFATDPCRCPDAPLAEATITLGEMSAERVITVTVVP